MPSLAIPATVPCAAGPRDDFQACYAKGLNIASTSNESKVDYVTVFAPSDLDERCPK